MIFSVIQLVMLDASYQLREDFKAYLEEVYMFDKIYTFCQSILDKYPKA